MIDLHASFMDVADRSQTMEIKKLGPTQDNVIRIAVRFQYDVTERETQLIWQK